MDEKRDFAVAEFPCSPDGPLKIHLTRKTIITENGFGSVPSIYPVTICPARYQGTYEGARWLCFPVYPEILGESRWRGWQSSDICCMGWWDQASRDGWPVGRGGSPDMAYQDLILRAGEKAGINPQDWVVEPTWDKTEIIRRSNGLRRKRRGEHRRECRKQPQLGAAEARRLLAFLRLAGPGAAG